MTNKRLYADIKESQQEDDEEQITGNDCPECGYLTVFELGVEVCYKCGWSEVEAEEN